MKIAIIGAGDVGRDIAGVWTQKGHQVTALTRHPEQLAHLAKVTQKCMVFKDIDESELTSLVHDNDVILITLSADSPDDYDESFLQTAHVFRKIALSKGPIRRLIYTNSTAIYGDHRGLWVDETSKLKSKTEQGKILIEAERVFQSLKDFNWHVCILRIAEIYGPLHNLQQRLKKLQGQTLPGSGKNYSNMVHCSDVTAAIDYALRYRLEGIYNLADDDHPTRKELYDRISSNLGIPLIQWDNKTSSWRGGNKRISNYKIKTKGFSFKFPNRMIE